MNGFLLQIHLKYHHETKDNKTKYDKTPVKWEICKRVYKHKTSLKTSHRHGCPSTNTRSEDRDLTHIKIYEN